MVFPRQSRVPPIDPSVEARRVREHLRGVVDDTDTPRALLERRAGFRPGYLGQVLTGTIELKLRHVLAVLDAVEMPPRRFFARVYPKPRGPIAPRRPVVPDHCDIASVYGFGLESLQRLCERLEQCEQALSVLDDRGVLDDP